MSKIHARLTRQLRALGVKNAARMAKGLLNKYGITKKGSTKLTAKGKRRNAMSNGQRAKDRAAKKAGNRPSEYKYNPRTNRATLRRRK
jgi:hypothetical protein